MAMTDTERVTKRLKRLIEHAHNENYDFVYIPVGTAKLILKLQEIAQQNVRISIHGICLLMTGHPFVIC